MNRFSMNEALMYVQGMKTGQKVGGKKAKSGGKGCIKCIPFLHLKRHEDNGWGCSGVLT